MGKKKVMPIDFQFGIIGIIPSTQQAYSKDGFDIKKKIQEKEGVKIFLNDVNDALKKRHNELKNFPTRDHILISIIQYFASEKECTRRDVDNMAKTMLDLLKSKIYKDDNQIRTLFVHKRVDKRIPQNFAYIAFKSIKNENNSLILKTIGIERSIQLYGITTK